MCCRILCYGDSNTYGYDPRSYLGGQYPDTVRWVSLLEKQGWIVSNEGENGRSIPQHSEVDRAVRMICQQKPDIVTIMLGSNDLLQNPNISAADCAKRMELFLTVLLKQSPPCEFLLIAPPPMKRGAWLTNSKMGETSRCLPKVYKTTAYQLGIHFADSGPWEIPLAFDGIHFSEAGHLIFAQELVQILKRITVKNGREDGLCLADRKRNQ